MSHRTLRRLLPGYAVSSIGDGMSIVAVSWLAIQLAPTHSRAAWVALAVAAYTLPGAIGVLTLGRLLGNLSPVRLAGWDALLRTVALGAIPVCYAFGGLGIGLYTGLLAVSSILHSWGRAGIYTLLARLLAERDHLAGNAVLSMVSSLTAIIGPPLAALVIATSGAATVIAIDAATFAVLAVTYFFAVPGGSTAPTEQLFEPSRSQGFSVIFRNPALLGLMLLTLIFFFLFGPVYIALPLHVKYDLHGSAGLLSAFFTVFGVGAALGATVTGFLNRWPMWRTIIGIVIVFGAVMFLVGLNVPLVVALIAFAVCGFLWPPYASLSTTLFQRCAPYEQLPQALAASSAVQVLSVPMGIALGGFLIGQFGAGWTLLGSAMGILALGLIAAAAVAFRKPAVSQG